MERGEWRADLVSSLLQIRPSSYYGYKCFAQEFAVIRDTDAARSIARNNPQYGSGGGERVFIPAASHARSLQPAGDLITLGPSDLAREPTPAGAIADIIRLELSLGNVLLRSDDTDKPTALRRSWLQHCLHLEEIRGAVNVPTSVQWFEDPDIYGSASGYISTDDSQVIVAPLPKRPSRSWLRRFWPGRRAGSDDRA
jgi:hypothetical protein